VRREKVGESKGAQRNRTKLTKQQVLEIETLAAVLSVEQMADYFGIGKTTFYELMKQQPGAAIAVGPVVLSESER
jgi:hypothetical protein